MHGNRSVLLNCNMKENSDQIGTRQNERLLAMQEVDYTKTTLLISHF